MSHSESLQKQKSQSGLWAVWRRAAREMARGNFGPHPRLFSKCWEIARQPGDLAPTLPRLVPNTALSTALLSAESRRAASFQCHFAQPSTFLAVVGRIIYADSVLSPSSSSSNLGQRAQGAENERRNRETERAAPQAGGGRREPSGLGDDAGSARRAQSSNPASDGWRASRFRRRTAAVRISARPFLGAGQSPPPHRRGGGQARALPRDAGARDPAGSAGQRRGWARGVDVRGSLSRARARLAAGGSKCAGLCAAQSAAARRRGSGRVRGDELRSLLVGRDVRRLGARGPVRRSAGRGDDGSGTIVVAHRGVATAWPHRSEGDAGASASELNIRGADRFDEVSAPARIVSSSQPARDRRRGGASAAAFRPPPRRRRRAPRSCSRRRATC